jgi:hypothetical protein
MTVIATNVTSLPDDNREPARYRHRVDGWRRLVEAADACCQGVPDPADLVSVPKDRTAREKEPRKKAATVDGLWMKRRGKPV